MSLDLVAFLLGSVEDHSTVAVIFIIFVLAVGETILNVLIVHGVVVFASVIIGHSLENQILQFADSRRVLLLTLTFCLHINTYFKLIYLRFNY